jgi:uncharacterized protein
VVRIVLGLYPSGCLRSLEAEGHAGRGSRGGDPVCAAVSVLLRTALNVLEREPGITFTGSIPDSGRTSIRISRYDETAGERLLGATNFLLTGLFDLTAEYPGQVATTFEGKTTEE